MGACFSSHDAPISSSHVVSGGLGFDGPSVGAGGGSKSTRSMGVVFEQHSNPFHNKQNGGGAR